MNEEYKHKIPNTNHQLDNFQMRCKKCGENVPSDSLQTHGCYSTQHVSSQIIGIVQPVQCAVCLKTFKNRNSLKVHKSTYHRPKDTAASGMRLSHLADIITTSTSTPLPVATESLIASYPSGVSSSNQTQVQNESNDNDNKMFHIPMYSQSQTLLALLNHQQYSEYDAVDKKPPV
ncbi:unnamed protein product [Orchesella dallaii]|uniref:C2H2-type domain-containing protein n=1 Tax=Orchesella dallaii TaxID=48710 RepID=A0ABP1QUW9_9HEXA